MRYVLLFPAFTGGAYDLGMDKAIVPALLAQRPGWDVAIASHAAGNVPPGVRSIVYGRGGLASLQCILRLAPTTDVLQLIHFDRNAILRAILYKARNHRGICHVRLGASSVRSEHLERLAGDRRYTALLRLGLAAVDLVSAETAESLERFRRLVARYPLRHPPETTLVPACGFDTDAVTSHLQKRRAVKTDILFVGRVGAPVKALDVLLAAFQRLHEKHGVAARLDLVGPIQPGFDEVFTRWAAGASDATRSAVSLPGPVWDRGALMDRYLGAKVFVICSRSEGGPNAFVEAASCGCLLVGTPVGQIPDVIRAAGGWEAPIGDVGALAAALAEAVTAPYSEAMRAERIGRFARAYSWRAVIDRLTAQLTALHQAKEGRLS